MHFISNITIAIDGDTARSESYCHATSVLSRPDGYYHQQVGGRMVDRFLCHNGAWKISAPRTVLKEWNRVDPIHENIDDYLQNKFSFGSRSRDDPSYFNAA